MCVYVYIELHKSQEVEKAPEANCILVVIIIELYAIFGGYDV